VSRPSNKPAPAAAPAPAPVPARGKLRAGALRIRLGAQQVELQLRTSERAARVIAEMAQPYSGGEGLPGPAAPIDLVQAVGSVRAALDAFSTRLLAENKGALAGLPCDVVVDDSWMLYDVVRADLRALSPRAADALIGASLADVAGIEASELASRWQPQGHSAYTLACGLPGAALPVLLDALRAHRLAARAVEGEFVLQFNRYRERFDPRRSVIALVRDAGAQLAVLVDGALACMSFEFGVSNSKELELRGRGLLRIAGVGGEGPVQFFAMSPAEWKAPEPWVCLGLAP
jgi:hypothetical protein